MSRVTAHEEFKRLELPAGFVLECCPVCAALPQLWQRSNSRSAPTHKAVCCENGDRIGPQDGLLNEGCLLNMPPEDFYRATIREAVAYWNQFAVALEQQRADRNAPHNEEGKEP